MSDDSSNVTPISATKQGDLWTGEDLATSGYHPSKFYIHSTDKKGFKNVIHAGVPPYIAGHIQAMIEQRQYPEYRTQADFVRDAIVHRLKWLSDNLEMNQEQREAVELTINRAELDGMIREGEEREVIYRTLESALATAKLRDDRWLIKETIEKYLKGIERVREPYKTKTLKLISDYTEWLKRV